MSADAVAPFEPHMTFSEVKKLKTGDRVDYRASDGKFFAATIVWQNLHTNTFRIHYDDANGGNVVDTPISELHKFATYRSISQRPAHRLLHAHKGMFVDINNVTMHPGWRKAEIIATDRNSGQIKVQYKYDISGGRRNPALWITWVHRDNVNEVDKYGTYSSIKTIEHLPISLETKRAYLNTPNEVKQTCAEEIVETVYGGMTNLLSHLIETASTSELQQMHEIMKKKTIKYQETVKTTKNKANKANENTNNESMDNRTNTNKPKISSLSEISRDCIDHICGYLNREDIKSFKLTSYRNGIVSLMQMTKSTVSIINANDIINPENPYYVDMVGIIKSRRFDRYPANTKFLALRQKWEEKYEIPFSKQLIFGLQTKAFTVYDDGQINNELIKTIPSLKFVLFDTRNIIIFNKHGDPPEIIDCIGVLKQKIGKIQVIIIKYFDIFSQEMVPLQILIGDRGQMTIGRLTKYVEDEFIATTPQQKIWHSKMIESFKKLNKIAPNYEKLIVYTESSKKRQIYPAINPIDTLTPLFWAIFIFQLNPNHPSFSKCKFLTIPEKYDILNQ